jgi:A/G-specific adenine glycosylase
LDVRHWAFDVFFIRVNPFPNAVLFRRSLLTWYRQHGRDLPWRRTRDPYAILVSEFMLQQTQIATVIPYYDAWMRRFPDFAALATASEQEVLHAWQGLGYYARARNLRATAIAVMEKHGGTFPQRLAEIEGLPGIGRYTARAVATFAFDQSVPIVEANITRLLARVADLQIPIDTSAGREMLWSGAEALLPNRAAGVHNSALMDLGALVCTTRPRCELCPVKMFCRASNPAALPKKRPRRALELRTEHHSFSLCRHRVLLEQSRDRWQGMWVLPRLALAPAASKALHLSQFPFTHHRITLAVHAHESTAKKNRRQRWFPISELRSIPVPSPHRRALNQILALPRS